MNPNQNVSTPDNLNPNVNTTYTPPDVRENDTATVDKVAFELAFRMEDEYKQWSFIDRDSRLGQPYQAVKWPEGQRYVHPLEPQKAAVEYFEFSTKESRKTFVRGCALGAAMKTMLSDKGSRRDFLELVVSHC